MLILLVLLPDVVDDVACTCSFSIWVDESSSLSLPVPGGCGGGVSNSFASIVWYFSLAAFPAPYTAMVGKLSATAINEEMLTTVASSRTEQTVGSVEVEEELAMCSLLLLAIIILLLLPISLLPLNVNLRVKRTVIQRLLVTFKSMVERISFNDGLSTQRPKCPKLPWLFMKKIRWC